MLRLHALAGEAALPVYVGAGSWIRLLQERLFVEVLSVKGVPVGGWAAAFSSPQPCHADTNQ
jgi:hypothetical protein